MQNCVELGGTSYCCGFGVVCSFNAVSVFRMLTLDAVFLVLVKCPFHRHLVNNGHCN